MGSAFIISGCSGDDPTPQSNTQAVVTLNSEILSAPLSPTEADRFFAVTATTGNQYYATGFTTVADDSQMALARFGPTGGLDTSFGSKGIATVNVAVGAGKKAELARSVVQSDGKIMIAGPIEHDRQQPGTQRGIPTLPLPASTPLDSWIRHSEPTE
ncbi:MAG: delta-60 repeat domain-containing protein [Nitrospiraceae bacterium]